MKGLNASGREKCTGQEVPIGRSIEGEVGSWPKHEWKGDVGCESPDRVNARIREKRVG